jgi:cardiolipin synthase A/B
MMSNMWQPSAIVYLILSICISSVVTAHILLHKRNVHSAVGWIGLAWLAPYLGTLLYYAFGINRIQRRARIMRHPRKGRGSKTSEGQLNSDSFANLRTTVGSVTHRPLVEANIALPLHDGDDAYPQMLAAIKSAQKTIALTSYIFRSDKIGQEFIDALGEASKRGVMVRVMIDGFGSSKKTFRLFKLKNVPVVRFMNSIWPWQMHFINLRQHKKVLIIDGVKAFIGGLNISDENTGRKRKKIKVRDTHFRLSGPIVRQITDDFIDDWLFACGEILDEPLWNPHQHIVGKVKARIIVSGPDQETEQLSLTLLSAISAAQKTIRIATPYFLPDELLMSALQLAVIRGVEVKIVLPEFSDHAPMNWAMHAHIGPLLQVGCQVFKAPPPFDHSKLMVVDDAWVLFGSPNWDTRSMRLNFEMAIEAYDPVLATQLSREIDENSVTPLTLNELEARSFVIKCRDAAVRLLIPYL